MPATNAAVNASGGQGITIQFDVLLHAPEIMSILVGQNGQSDTNNGGGGGGTFVVVNGVILAVAGGGGGRRFASTGVGIDGGSYATYSGYGVCSSTNAGAVATLGPNGPKAFGVYVAAKLGQGGPSFSNFGDGASGYFGTGFDDSVTNTQAQSYVNGGTGGIGTAGGGFGGGASGAGSNGGGGGGGYTGGCGGYTAGCYVYIYYILSYIYVYIYIYYIILYYIFVFVFVFIFTYMYIYVIVYMCVRTNIYVYIFLYIFMYTYIVDLDQCDADIRCNLHQRQHVRAVCDY